MLVDVQHLGVPLPEGFKQVEALYFWIDEYIPKVVKDLEGTFLYPSLPYSFSHCHK